MTMEHCANCIHRDEAGTSSACFYSDDEYRDRHGLSKNQPCRELTEYGATYHCFESRGDIEPWGALEWLMEAFDKLDCRLENIENGLKMATKR